jgi:hypothetical protein
MASTDIELRNATYRLFAETGRAPSAADVASVTGRRHAEVLAGWRRLHDSHALVLDDDRTSIRMANPFSAVPTAYRVRADGREWFANCAWDAFGICAALGVDGDIRTECPDCSAAITTGVRDRQPTNAELVFHCLVPASQWWDDIAFT